MEPIDILVFALIAGGAWLYFHGTPASPTSAQYSPTPVAIAQSAGQAPAGVAPPGTTVALRPLASSAVPPDSFFIDHAVAVYEQGTGLKPSNRFHAGFVKMTTAAIASMQASVTEPGVGRDDCAAVSVPNISFSQVAMMGGTAAETGFAAASLIGGAGSAAAGIAATAIPIIGIGLGIVSLIAGIFAHHKQKVKQQAQLDCAVVNAVNNAWAQMKQAIAAGKLAAADAYSGFEAIYSQAAQNLASMSNGPHPGQCNNPCNLTLILRAVTDKFEAMYGLVGA